MRNGIVLALLKQVPKPDFCFLTGDLGFMALEPLQKELGSRFINMGIAEQNMVSVAAGLARSGFRPWVYSICPFCYARPFEQIRNDVALHKLPVRLVGNGAGYGYGVQGPTHHAIEDCGVMGALQNMRVLAPAFAADLEGMAEFLSADPRPAYIRLGRDFIPAGFKAPPFELFRILSRGGGPVVFSLGNITGVVLDAAAGLPEESRPVLCCCCSLPDKAEDLPRELMDCLSKTRRRVIVVEEHVSSGGLGERVGRILLESGAAVESFVSRRALGYPGKRYGSQQYYQEKSGLDKASLRKLIAGA